MYFQFKKNQLVAATKNDHYDIVLYSQEAWHNLNVEFPIKIENQYYNKVECYGQNMFGVCMLNKKEKKDHFFYILSADHLIIVDDTNYVKTKIKILQESKQNRVQDKNHLYRYLLDSLIDSDVLDLERLEEHLEKLEIQVLKNELNEFNSHLMSLKRETSRFYRYYHQLEDVAGKLLENELDLFDDNDMKSIQLFNGRISRLKSEALVLKDYAIQIQEGYQAQIGIQQNNVMKFLTIVTAVFLPLTLIVGWYGMNFTHMPELAWEFGYPFVIVIAVLIVVFCLWYFKKRNYL